MKKTIICSLIAVIIASPLASQQVYSITDIQERTLRAGCEVSQAELRRVWQRDGVERATLGQIYENVYQHILSPFNRRAIRSNAETAQLTAIAKEYRSIQNRFREDYTVYHETLNAAIKVGCKGDMERYVDLIGQARELRALVRSSTEDIAKVLKSYSAAVNTLKKSTDGKDV